MVPVYLNISNVNKTFVWLPHRTGSNHMVEVLKNFDFDFYKIENNIVKFHLKGTRNVHSFGFFEGSENYHFMSPVRNPYSMEVSIFRMNLIPNQKVKEFKYYLKNSPNFLEKVIFSSMYTERKPDIIIKLENLYEDYIKVPFIKESSFYESGQLKKLVDTKINYYNLDNINWKELYDEENAEIVFKKHKRYFETFGYDLNSWKN